MCGIVGIIGRPDAAPLILEALKRLEYRGYDSAGIATLADGRIERRRAPGKLTNLAAVLAAEPLPGAIGIGHTRWATHGAPTEENAHPHSSERVAVVHNGIIENFKLLREELIEKQHRFESETDTEVVVHLVTENLRQGHDVVEAARLAIRRLEGAFGLVLMFRGDEDLLVVARQGSPLAIGFGEGAMYVGSDAFALAPFTNRVAYLEDGDWAFIRRSGAEIFDATDCRAERPVRVSSVSSAIVGKGEHRHFMAKEIFEQPQVVADTLNAYVDAYEQRVSLPQLPFDLSKVERITMSACGTAFYAALIGKYWVEKLARISVDADVASEFRYREAPLVQGGLALFVSQSGETADTLAALRYCKLNGQHIASVVNVPESSIARDSDIVLPTHAGPEIGVASTKAFTCQLAVLGAFAVALARLRGAITAEDERAYVQHLLEAPRLMNEILAQDAAYQNLATDLAKARDVLYLGRGLAFPLALEGALKLKEISYIHAEAYAAGEMKHGPIALIDQNVPVVMVAPHDALFEKTASNMHEVMARGGKVILISDRKGIEAAGARAFATLEVPEADPFLTPLLYAVPLQLLAYHTAVAKGTDVDQPRNLAKSVTVE